MSALLSDQVQDRRSAAGWAGRELQIAGSITFNWGSDPGSGRRLAKPLDKPACWAYSTGDITVTCLPDGQSTIELAQESRLPACCLRFYSGRRVRTPVCASSEEWVGKCVVRLMQANFNGHPSAKCRRLFHVQPVG